MLKHLKATIGNVQAFVFIILQQLFKQRMLNIFHIKMKIVQLYPVITAKIKANKIQGKKIYTKYSDVQK